MRANRLLALVALIVLIIVLGYGLKLAYSPKPSILQGQIEAREYHVSSKVAGRIDQVLVRRGDQVKAGDLLFSIHSPELDAKLMQAEGGRNAALALKKEADAGARKQQVMAAREQWQKAKAGATLAKTTFDRVENLFNEGVLPRQKRDEAYTQWQAAKYTEQAASAMYHMAEEGARKETKAAAAGKAMMAQGALNEVQSVLKDSQMRATHDGEVSEVLLFNGELAPTGFPVVTLTDMQDSWALLQVREDLLSQFKMGQEMTLEIPALHRSARFKVSYISVMGNFATWRATEAGHDFDMRTFEVELKPVEAVDGLRAGMSVLLPM